MNAKAQRIFIVRITPRQIIRNFRGRGTAPSTSSVFIGRPKADASTFFENYAATPQARHGDIDAERMKACCKDEGERMKDEFVPGLGLPPYASNLAAFHHITAKCTGRGRRVQRHAARMKAELLPALRPVPGRNFYSIYNLAAICV